MAHDHMTADISNLPGPGSWKTSVVIPTYRRGAVLIETLLYLFRLDPAPGEILVVDQTEAPDPESAAALERLEREGKIRRIACDPPSIPRAMNRGLREAQGDVVLFCDDDIVPEPDLVERHGQAHAEHPDAWAVAGRVIQPEGSVQEAGDKGQGAGVGKSRLETHCAKGLGTDLDFEFNGIAPAWVENVMAGNLSVKREPALAIGGFDENFIPPVSFRFETEFARRLVGAGGRIWFEPRASIRHLRAGSGGTRSRGGHLASASPLHGVGDYYYALRVGSGWDRLRYIARRPFREVRTKFHLRHPWWIPVKFIGELRAIRMAVQLNQSGPKLLTTNDTNDHE
jgi:GT2 family glycosyltransferase